MQAGELEKRLPFVAAGDGRAIHRARVASRRLRETLAIVEAVRPRAQAGRVQRDVRRVTRALGPVRELDVAIEELRRGAGRHGWAADRVAAIERHIEREREPRFIRMKAAVAALDLERLVERCAAVQQVAAMPLPDRDWQRAIRARIEERADDLLAAIKECGTIYVPERLHAVRIALKKLRYALEAVLARVSDRLQPSLAMLQAAQRRFGHLHDLQVLQSQVDAAAQGSRRLASGKALTIMFDALERECRELHAELLGELTTLTSRVPEILRAVRGVETGRPFLAKARVPSPRPRSVTALRATRRG